MILISFPIFLILIATALLHTAWAFGSTWPEKDEQTLIYTVVGSKNATQMPPALLTILVALSIAFAGVIALWGTGHITLPLPQWIRTAGLITLTVVFLIRGFATYLQFGPLHHSVEPFLTLNRRYFSPLILAIGAGFLSITLVHIF